MLSYIKDDVELVTTESVADTCPVYLTICSMNIDYRCITFGVHILMRYVNSKKIVHPIPLEVKACKGPANGSGFKPGN